MMSIKALPKRLLLKGGTVLDPVSGKRYRGDVFLEDGKIRSLGKISAPKSISELDCSGLTVTHGFCDLHAHFREPGREDKETLETGSKAALAGGFTRVCVMPNTDPPLDTPEAIRFILEKSEKLPVTIHPIGAVTRGQKGEQLTEMGAMADEGAVAFSDDGLPIESAAVMRRALEYSTLVGLPVINHAEDPSLREGGLMNEGPLSTRLGLPGNPSAAESVMVHRDLELERLTQARLHVPHVSTATALDHIRARKKKSGNVTAEVTPHHLYFDDRALQDYDTHLKVAPPLRSTRDRKALIAGLKDGTLDCIATDHAPHTIEEKEATFDQAPFGMIGLESCFGAVNKVLVKESRWSLEGLIKVLTVNPRRILGLETDLFAVGQPAELVVLDPTEEWTFQREHIHSRSINSPFIGEKLLGRVKYTLSKGHLAQGF